jgi:hypothetical protein
LGLILQPIIFVGNITESKCQAIKKGGEVKKGSTKDFEK